MVEVNYNPVPAETLSIKDLRITWYWW